MELDCLHIPCHKRVCVYSVYSAFQIQRMFVFWSFVNINIAFTPVAGRRCKQEVTAPVAAFFCQ